jgi:hypothetical protein
MPYNHAAQAAIPYEQVAADAQPEYWRLRVEFAQESLQVFDTGRNEEQFGLSTSAP